MSDVERLIGLTRKLEAALRRRGAQGKGLHGLVSSIESDLPADLVKQLRWLATLRNKAVHEDGFRVQDGAAVDRAGHEALRRLGASALPAALVLPLGRSTTRFIWFAGSLIAGAAGFLFGPAQPGPTVAAGAGLVLAAWGLHPTHQPRVLALSVACAAVAAAVHWFS